MADQELRDKQFANVLKVLQATFHQKNLDHADSYLENPKTEQEAFFPIRHKYERIVAILKIPESQRTDGQKMTMLEDLRDLCVYSVMFDIWQLQGSRGVE
jgi:hypothetical protein